MKRRNWIAGLLALFFGMTVLAIMLPACPAGTVPQGTEVCVKFMRMPDGALTPITAASPPDAATESSSGDAP
jgi:hypothetical protein